MVEHTYLFIPIHTSCIFPFSVVLHLIFSSGRLFFYRAIECVSTRVIQLNNKCQKYNAVRTRILFYYVWVRFRYLYSRVYSIQKNSYNITYNLIPVTSYIRTYFCFSVHLNFGDRQLEFNRMDYKNIITCGIQCTQFTNLTDSKQSMENTSYLCVCFTCTTVLQCDHSIILYHEKINNDPYFI